MTQSIVLPNRIKRLLREGGTVVGCMVVEFRQPSVMQLLANAGFDFVIIDNEHGPFNLETIADLTRAALHVGLTPIVRVPELTYANIAQSLDAGAQGIMAPRVTAAKEVQDTVRAMKYPPLGVRGAALFRGHTQFHSGPMLENMQAANQETMLVVQIETKEAVESLDSILSVPGVDVALVGPVDLSVALGVPGQLDHPVMYEAIEKTIAACLRHQVIPSIHIDDLKLADYWAKHGMRMISSNSDAGMLYKKAKEVVTTIGQALGR